MEFCKCGSIILDGECSNRRCRVHDRHLTEWVIDGVPLKFKQPIRFSEALELSKDKKKLSEALVKSQAATDINALQRARADRINRKT